LARGVGFEPTQPLCIQPKKRKRRVTEFRRPVFIWPTAPFTRIRTPSSAERPDLGCSLPGLARFAWQTWKTTFLRRQLHDHQPRRTDTHGQRTKGQMRLNASTSAFGPSYRGFMVRAFLGARQGTPTPPPKTRRQKKRCIE